MLPTLLLYTYETEFSKGERGGGVGVGGEERDRREKRGRGERGGRRYLILYNRLKCTFLLTIGIIMRIDLNFAL